MTAPTITALPDPPQRSDSLEVFSAKADATVSAQVLFVTEANALGEYFEETTATVTAATSAAQAASESARDASVVAKDLSVAAKDAAVVAKTAAETARDAAAESASSAVTAGSIAGAAAANAPLYPTGAPYAEGACCAGSDGRTYRSLSGSNSTDPVNDLTGSWKQLTGSPAARALFFGGF